MRTLNIVMPFLVVILTITVQKSNAQKTNFSGTWMIDEQKSQFNGQSVNTMYKALKVRQTNDSLIVEGIRFNSGNQTSSTVVAYGLTGKPSSILLPNKRTMKASLIWTDDGKVLTRNSTYSLPDNPSKEDYRSEEVWSLADNGRVLTLKRTFFLSQGQTTVTAIYSKQ